LAFSGFDFKKKEKMRGQRGRASPELRAKPMEKRGDRSGRVAALRDRLEFKKR